MRPLPEPEQDGPTAVEAWGAAVAGAAFAVALLFVREATLVPAGVFDAVAAAVLAWGASRPARRRFGPFAATLVRGFGLVAATLLLTSALVPPFDRAVVPAALWVAGAALLQANARLERASLVAGALGGAALAAGWGLALWLADAFPEPARLRFALLVAGPLALAGLALRAALVRRGWRALAPMPVGLLLVVVLGAVYFAYRGLVASQVENLPLYEWSIGVAGAALLLTRLRRHAREGEAPEAWASDARRHAQDVAPVYDDRMAPLAAAVQRYLDHGDAFPEYRAAMRRAAPHAPPRYGAALDALRPVAGQGGGAAEAGARRLAAHQDLLKLLPHEAPTHGHSPPGLRPNP